ncbi:aminotransferase class IV [Marinicella gelatinilytica]|uniref:aminotransferase class IV n=1 Tax=Marinicella gelatinilytica TaxID=2996017 RepID=UPI0022608B7C|nr:aminotransferase class IV [Marinicella gelatinilytica]MCX7544249.1 aminotransferase class IV [Marinicella gelatinilytica]
MTTGSHAAENDPRNQDVLIYVNGEMVPRKDAKISVFDSGFLMGDGIWESARLHNGVLVFIDDHLKRLFKGAKALAMDLEYNAEDFKQMLYQTVKANGMHDHVHLRMMVTRGEKTTPYQSPAATKPGTTVVIIPEYKTPSNRKKNQGVKLFTAHVRRGYPDIQDHKINSHSKHNCIQACIQAIAAGADEALMLDPHGFVATCNSTHFFIVVNGEVWTSTGDFCLGGITRGKIIDLCGDLNIPIRQKNFSLFDVYSADEVFITGTFAGVTPVVSVDGRDIGQSDNYRVMKSLQQAYSDLIAAEVKKQSQS